MAIGWQIIVRRVDDSLIAATTRQRRALAACVGRVMADGGLICFGVAGGHGHWPGLWTRAQAGAAARALLVGMGRSLGHAGALEPARLRPWVAQQLPSIRRDDLTRLLGVEPADLDAADLSCLADAAAAALALPDLNGGRAPTVLARAAAVQLARPDFRSSTVAEALGTSQRSVQRLARLALSPDLVRAVAGQWRLRSWLRSRQDAP